MVSWANLPQQAASFRTPLHAHSGVDSPLAPAMGFGAAKNSMKCRIAEIEIRQRGFLCWRLGGMWLIGSHSWVGFYTEDELYEFTESVRYMYPDTEIF